MYVEEFLKLSFVFLLCSSFSALVGYSIFETDELAVEVESATIVDDADLNDADLFTTAKIWEIEHIWQGYVIPMNNNISVYYDFKTDPPLLLRNRRTVNHAKLINMPPDEFPSGIVGADDRTVNFVPKYAMNIVFVDYSNFDLNMTAAAPAWRKELLAYSHGPFFDGETEFNEEIWVRVFTKMWTHWSNGTFNIVGNLTDNSPPRGYHYRHEKPIPRDGYKYGNDPCANARRSLNFSKQFFVCIISYGGHSGCYRNWAYVWNTSLPTAWHETGHILGLGHANSFNRDQDGTWGHLKGYGDFLSMMGGAEIPPVKGVGDEGILPYEAFQIGWLKPGQVIYLVPGKTYTLRRVGNLNSAAPVSLVWINTITGNRHWFSYYRCQRTFGSHFEKMHRSNAHGGHTGFAEHVRGSKGKVLINTFGKDHVSRLGLTFHTVLFDEEHVTLQVDYDINDRSDYMPTLQLSVRIDEAAEKGKLKIEVPLPSSETSMSIDPYVMPKVRDYALHCPHAVFRPDFKRANGPTGPNFIGPPYIKKKRIVLVSQVLQSFTIPFKFPRSKGKLICVLHAGGYMKRTIRLQ